MGLFVKDTDFFGLDIGSTAIRLVQLRRGTAHPALVAYGSVPVSGNITSSDSKLDQDKVAELVQQLVHENHVSVKDVVVGLPSSKVFATVISTPKLDNDQLAKAIRYQAEQYIPMAINQVKLDWAVIDQSPDGKSLEVLLVAAPNSVVDKYVAILETAGLEPLALEANAIATTRALVPTNNLAVAILDLGSLDSDISIVWNNAPRLIRSVSVGGLTLVRAVAQNLGLDEVQANQFTYKFGLTQSKLEGQVYKAIKPTLDNLVQEIDKSVKYFNGRYPDVKLEKLVVTGSTAALPELGAFLANSVGMPVEFGNAWINVSYPSSLQDKLMGLSSEYAAAVGLAGRGYMA
ncbi:MAG TPA: type IV pilus assembly protein PilM [Candidatus Saccharimonadia bacterium]|nr:type IV pilus assembly protein PilM [Candidatus Saccharimonadia bacterium]